MLVPSYVQANGHALLVWMLCVDPADTRAQSDGATARSQVGEAASSVHGRAMARLGGRHHARLVGLAPVVVERGVPARRLEEVKDLVLLLLLLLLLALEATQRPVD